MSLRTSPFMKPIKQVVHYLKLPMGAKAESWHDAGGVPSEDPGITRAVQEGLAWLGVAQDSSRSQDGGVARHFSLVNGWATSYPETTGYIVPTMLACGKAMHDQTLTARGRRMLDWLVAIQLSDGGFQGGLIDARPVVSTTFNTGQILMGLAAGVEYLGDQRYCTAMNRAADHLVRTQDSDGCWRRHQSPFAGPGDKAYDTHVAWGLLEAARIDPNPAYGEAALRNVTWAIKHQQTNGWVANCCLSDPSQPLTHTLGYVLRGIVEAYRFSNDRQFLLAACRTADGLLTAIDAKGFLPGRLDPQWHGAVSWACLTGTAQIAHCWLMLHQMTGNLRYREAAFAANRYVRRTMRVEGSPDTRGAVKGSFPVSGGYGTYEYLNWAVKFFIDANLLEQQVRASAAGGAVRTVAA